MGKRSRRSQQPVTSVPVQSKRVRARKASELAAKAIDKRPVAPWHPFPLVEIVILGGLVSLVVGAVTGGQSGKFLLVLGLLLACLGGLDVAIREHFAGYRSHSFLLASALAMAVGMLLAYIFGLSLAVLTAIVLGIIATTYGGLRSVFLRRSGGVGLF